MFSFPFGLNTFVPIFLSEDDARAWSGMACLSVLITEIEFDVVILCL
jgi:hypothetical protein